MALPAIDAALAELDREAKALVGRLAVPTGYGYWGLVAASTLCRLVEAIPDSKERANAVGYVAGELRLRPNLPGSTKAACTEHLLNFLASETLPASLDDFIRDLAISHPADAINYLQYPLSSYRSAKNKLLQVCLILVENVGFRDLEPALILGAQRDPESKVVQFLWSQALKAYGPATIRALVQQFSGTEDRWSQDTARAMVRLASIG